MKLKNSLTEEEESFLQKNARLNQEYFDKWYPLRKKLFDLSSWELGGEIFISMDIKQQYCAFFKYVYPRDCIQTNQCILVCALQNTPEFRKDLRAASIQLRDIKIGIHKARMVEMKKSKP